MADGSTLVATPDHLFWSIDQNDWVELANIAAGETLLSPDGLVEVAQVSAGEEQDWTEMPDGTVAYYESGTNGPAWLAHGDPSVPPQNQAATHVEGHVAQDMVENGWLEATVRINHEGGPCDSCYSASDDARFTLAQQVLPKGYTLHVQYWNVTTGRWEVETILGLK